MIRYSITEINEIISGLAKVVKSGVDKWMCAEAEYLIYELGKRFKGSGRYKDGDIVSADDIGIVEGAYAVLDGDDDYE